MTALKEDRTTIDMFKLKEAGRPRTNPHTRQEQLRINKRMQRERDRTKGLKRVELKMASGQIEELDRMARIHKKTRAELIEQILNDFLSKEHLSLF
jgi:hypothetical protein